MARGSEMSLRATWLGALSECPALSRVQPDGCQRGRRQAVLEKPLPAAEDHRVDHQAVFVYELMPSQGLNQLGAAGNQNVAAGLLLELGHLVDNVAAQDRGVVPVCFLQRTGDDVLRHRIHPLSEADVVLDRAPRGGASGLDDASWSKVTRASAASSWEQYFRADSRA